MEKKSIAETVRALAEPVAAELGLEIWDVEYVKEGADMYLRIIIDKDEGIDIEDCERMSRAIDPLLDEADPIEESYRLEVSSPGIERDLTRPEHFEKCMGEKVEVRLFAPLEGRKQIVGILSAYDGNEITIDENGENVILPKKSVSKVTTVFDW